MGILHGAVCRMPLGRACRLKRRTLLTAGSVSCHYPWRREDAALFFSASARVHAGGDLLEVLCGGLSLVCILHDGFYNQ